MSTQRTEGNHLNNLVGAGIMHKINNQEPESELPDKMGQGLLAKLHEK